MPLLETIKRSWFHPTEFFAGLKDAGVGPAWKYYALIRLVPTIIIAAVAALPLGILGVTGAVAGYLIGLALVFVGVAILHVFVYLLNGRAGYSKTFQAVAYGSTPISLLSWIPMLLAVSIGFTSIAGLVAAVLIGLALGLWSLYNTAVGVSTLHRMSLGRAVFALLLPVIIIFAVVFVLGLLTTLWLSSLVAGGVPVSGAFIPA